MRTFEDFTVGTTEIFGDYLVTEDEIIEFAQKYDPQPFHTDPEFAKNFLHGQLIASGWMTCSIMMRLMCDHILSHSCGLPSPGMDRLRWIRPVYAQDHIKVATEVIMARRSKSKPDIGIVTLKIKAFNQKDEAVLSLVSTNMFYTREGYENNKQDVKN